MLVLMTFLINGGGGSDVGSSSYSTSHFFPPVLFLFPTIIAAVGRADGVVTA